MTENILEYESTIWNTADLLRITIDDDEWTTFTITEFDVRKYADLQDYYKRGLIPRLSRLDSKTQLVAVETLDACYSYDPHRSVLMRKQGGQMTDLGSGKIEITAAYKLADKTRPERIEITAALVICNARGPQKSGASHTT